MWIHSKWIILNIYVYIYIYVITSFTSHHESHFLSHLYLSKVSCFQRLLQWHTITCLCNFYQFLCLSVFFPFPLLITSCPPAPVGAAIHLVTWNRQRVGWWKPIQVPLQEHFAPRLECFFLAFREIALIGCLCFPRFSVFSFKHLLAIPLVVFLFYWRLIWGKRGVLFWSQLAIVVKHTSILFKLRNRKHVSKRPLIPKKAFYCSNEW